MNIYARISVNAAAGAVAGLIQSLIIVALSKMYLFPMVGIPFEVFLTKEYLYQRASWGAIWGLLFLIPIATSWPNPRRGLIFAAGPALASLFIFLPLEGMGVAGLKMGPAWPGVVVVFALVWGWIAGMWLDRVYGLVKDD